MEFLNKYFWIYLPGAFSIIGFFIPKIDIMIKVVGVLVLSLLYYLIYSIILFRRYQYVHGEKSKKDKDIEKLESNIRELDGFVNKRAIFLKHDLIKVEAIVLEYEGYLKEAYVEKRYKPMRDEYRTVKKEILEVTSKEKRDFDEQLLSLQSNKNN